MKRLVLVFVIVSFVLSVASSISLAAKYEITKITSDDFTTNYYKYPDINNDGEVVWEFQRKIVSNYRGIVSPRGACPSISNTGEIVWLNVASGLGDWQIFSNTHGQLTFGRGVEYNGDEYGCPKVNSSGEVVYVATAYDGDFRQIYSTKRGQITFNRTYHSYPAINDLGEIIWIEPVDDWGMEEIGFGWKQVFSSTSGQLTFDYVNKEFLDLNNLEEFSYVGLQKFGNVFSSVNGMIIPDEKQIQVYSGINDRGDIVYSKLNKGIFLASIKKNPPVLKITANGMENLTITNLDGLSLSVSLDPVDYADQDADWWLFMKSPNGFFSYSSGMWHRYMTPLRMQELETKSIPNVAHFAHLPIGKYTFHFCVDTVMDGILDLDKMFCDSAEVEVVRWTPYNPVTVTKNKSFGDQKLVPGMASTKVSNYVIKATADVVIDKLVEDIIPVTPGSSLSDLRDLTVMDSTTGAALGNEIAVPKRSNTFEVNLNIAKGGAKAITSNLGISANAGIGHSYRTRLQVFGHNPITGRTFQTAVVTGQTFTVVRGEIKASLSTNTPVSRLVVFGSQNEFVMENSFNAAYEGFTTSGLKLSLNDSQNIMKAACSIANITVKYRDKSGAEQSATSALWYDQSQNVPQAIFTGITHYTPANSISSLKYYVSFLDFESSCGSSGVEVKLTLEEFRAVGDSGTEIIGQPKITGNPMYVYKSVPVITSKTLNSDVLRNGQIALARWNVASNNANPIETKKQSFKVDYSSNLKIERWEVFDTVSNTSIIEAQLLFADPHEDGTTTAYVVAELQPEDSVLVISNISGASLELQAVVSGVRLYSGQFISTKMMIDAVYGLPDFYKSVSSLATTTLIWSDRSAPNHSVHTPDWNNGYLAQMPTTAWLLTKQADAPELIWPVPKNTINIYFHDPKYPYRYLFEHIGIDIKADQGTELVAAAAGKVVRTNTGGEKNYGYIYITHSNDLATVYGHVSEIIVKEGDYVEQGQLIGLTGGTPGTPGAGPLTSGPHLHFEVRLKGIPVDPLNYIKE